MDTKLKIILVIFVVLILFYLCYFIFNYYESKTINSVKKTKEAFTLEDDDDVEHYEEPQATTTTKEKSSASEYDQRVFILDEIEKLNIDDKEIKGKLMESLFSEASLKKLETMSSKDKRDFIKKEHDTLTAVDTTTAAEATPAPKEKSTFKDIKNIAAKAKEAIDELTSVQKHIGEIKNILENQKSTFVNEVPAEPVLPSIEGFENVSRYATYNRLSS